jgi:hypothetical protein
VPLDLRYDIKADKHAFFQPYQDESALVPDWVHLLRQYKQFYNSHRPHQGIANNRPSARGDAV